jgi:hypothetical protein
MNARVMCGMKEDTMDARTRRRCIIVQGYVLGDA